MTIKSNPNFILQITDSVTARTCAVRLTSEDVSLSWELLLERYLKSPAFDELLKNGRIERLLNQEEIIHAITNPPVDTRAYFRGMCLQKFPNEIHSASWNSIIFCIDGSSLDKILMDRPHFGTREIVGDLLRDCKVAELVQAILASNN